jgi:outer membrane immunogenic protein
MGLGKSGARDARNYWGKFMKITLALCAALLACVPGMAAAQDAEPATEQGFDGVRVEARLGYETPTVSGDGDIYKLGSAVSYGGEIGFDLKVGNKVVVGPYATYEFSSVKLCDGPDCLKEDGNLGVGGRIGVIVSPTVLIYAKAGYANIKFSVDSSIGAGSDSKGGVQGAIGVDVNFGKHFYGFVEGNYGDYGEYFGFNLQRRHVAAGVGLRF